MGGIAEMSKLNLVDPNGYLEIADIWLVGQTITLESTTPVYYIDFEVWWADGRHPIGLGVYLTDDQHHPVQPMIASAITTWGVQQKLKQRVRTRFSFRDFTMEAGVEYFFLMRDKMSHFATNSRLYIRKGDNPFPDGNLFYSEDYGDTWTSYPDDDWIFAICGAPEVPPPPPDPPIKNVATLDLQQEVTSKGIIITVTTNVPCHLYCYWTATKPGKHLIPILTRGIQLHTQLQMCFVDWNENEQEEAGDTLIHTFTKEPWPHCETRWLTFRAMIMGKWVSPATEKMSPPKQWSPFHEPWGVHLTENNAWRKFYDANEPQVMLAFGICELTNLGDWDCGLYTSTPPPFPIFEPENSEPLLISFNNTEVTEASDTTQIYIELVFIKEGVRFTIYLAISLGSEFEHLKPQFAGERDEEYYGIFYVGPGEFTKDLYQLFLKFRTELGLSTDPTGWELLIVALTLSTQAPAAEDTLKSDYLTLYYTDPVIPWSPSVSPIFKKHRFYTPPPNEMEFAAVHETGYIAKYGADWYTAWSAEEGLPAEGEPYYMLMARAPGIAVFTIVRGILRFDTSALPDDIEIVEATLKIAFFRNVFETYHSHICFVTAVGCGDNMAVGDYGALRENTEQICDWIEIPPLDLETYYERDLYQVQLSIINKEGQTRIGIRGSPDLFNFVPYSGNLMWLDWYGDDSMYEPKMLAKLIVRWK